MKVAVVGVTGLVGGVMLDVLGTRLGSKVSGLIPVASERSVGSNVHFRGDELQVVSLAEAVAAKPDVALFSAGGDVSLEWAPRFAEAGTVVIDNSSAWRMDPDKLLIVPEINGHLLKGIDASHGAIIANPNCSTIQLVMALAPLHARWGVQRVVVSTYQSVTGTGSKAIGQLERERRGEAGEMAYPHRIHDNVLPHCDVFLENGYTKEEMKLVWETAKILDPAIQVTATAVRVPVTGGHSESVNVQLAQPFELHDVRTALEEAKGVQVVDDPLQQRYPMPMEAKDSDPVYVGRIRRDESQANGLNMWVVADNLRKGAATNAVQILEELLANQTFG